MVNNKYLFKAKKNMRILCVLVNVCFIVFIIVSASTKNSSLLYFSIMGICVGLLFFSDLFLFKIYVDDDKINIHGFSNRTINISSITYIGIQRDKTRRTGLRNLEIAYYYRAGYETDVIVYTIEHMDELIKLIKRFNCTLVIDY